MAQPDNPDTRPLPAGWLTQYHTNSNAWFYFNTVSVPPVTTWTHPLDQVYAPSRLLPPSSDDPSIEEAHALASDTIKAWHARKPLQLPPLDQLPAFLKTPLPWNQKIPVPDEYLAQLVETENPTELPTIHSNLCTLDDVRLLFRGGGGISVLVPYYFIVAKDPPSHAQTKDDFHHFWDDNIGELLQLLIPDGKSRRNNMTSFRPDYAFLFHGVCPFRGEEKEPESQDDPKVELARKLNKPWPYLEAPYILGYYTLGPRLTLAAICSDNGQTVVKDLMTLNLRLKKHRIQNMVALINLAQLFNRISELVKPAGPEFQQMERDTCIVEMANSYIYKKFIGSSEIQQAKIDHLEHIYTTLLSKNVPHTDRPVYFRRDEATVILHPRGEDRGPKTREELLDAITCVLQMLECLHRPPTIIHRDIRWPNIIRSFEDRKDWFIIDWSDATQAPACAESTVNFQPHTHCPSLFEDNHGSEVDLWGVGELLLTSKVMGLDPWLTEFGRSLKDTHADIRATAALQRIRDWRAGPRHEEIRKALELEADGPKREASQDPEESAAHKRPCL
ncbi:hypothetical protein C8F01DRAFT_577072 [Mycena amicta]|nr:hypothetical protein C8F01DRAFT_577072 [Mycena amicta]